MKMNFCKMVGIVFMLTLNMGRLKFRRCGILNLALKYMINYYVHRRTKELK